MKVRSLMFGLVALASKMQLIRRPRLKHRSVALLLSVPLNRPSKTLRLSHEALLPALNTSDLRHKSRLLLLLNRQQTSVTRKNSSNYYGTS
jgi:hypothetical protein